MKRGKNGQLRIGWKPALMIMLVVCVGAGYLTYLTRNLSITDGLLLALGAGVVAAGITAWRHRAELLMTMTAARTRRAVPQRAVEFRSETIRVVEFEEARTR